MSITKDELENNIEEKENKNNSKSKINKKRF